jgi:hypothetical protein
MMSTSWRVVLQGQGPAGMLGLVVEVDEAGELLQPADDVHQRPGPY